jgi:hypothetical protein
MRSLMIMMVVCICSIVKAGPKAPSVWWCYSGIDNNVQMTSICFREKSVCENDINKEDYVVPPKCTKQSKAAVFIITHKSDGRVEYSARPNVDACQAVSSQMAADSPDVIIGSCHIE